MPFNNNRNSRDDKSGKDYKNSDRSESAGRSNSDSRSSSSFNKDKKSYGDKKEFSGDRKPYGSRDGGNSFADRKAYGDKRENSSDKKPYGTREGGSSYGEKKPYGTRDSGSSYGDRKPYGDKREGAGDRKPYGSREGGSSYGDRKPYGDKREGAGDRKPYGSREGGSSYGDRKPYGDKREGAGDRKPYGSREGGSSYGDRKPYGDKREGSDDRKPYGNRERGGSYGDKKPFGDRNEENRKPFVSSDKSFNKEDRREGFSEEKRTFKDRGDKPYRKRKTDDDQSNEFQDDQVKLKSKGSNKPVFKKDGDTIRLNRFIANSGICSRRKADELIIAGVVTVNGEAVSELGTKINPAVDQIRYNGELLKREKMVYVLLNKPKDYITTTDDPQERKTVMELVDKASRERIYPVGRLDRNTTGLLLLTNDGDLADKLSHPKNSISKIYHVELNKNLTQGDFNKIAFGLELEDGLIKPDEVKYVTGGSKNEIGIQIHSGKNRIVRRIFESLGYEVIKLDRVIYANLTKKDLTRGRWRYLTEKEVIQLKHFTKGQF
ncbi:pseudouridine synthase [Pedobacter alpinus]|uniref:Pseudouridine synthase n=1 Tax=Pedobacter alpinus TaxID=1590643 RepID=A0ABW5TRH7_9SPHI